MQFSNARPDVVRAISQRWLLKFWQRQLGAHSVPRWQAVEAEDVSRLSSNLSFLDVVGGDGGLRFQIRFHGEVIGQVYGSPDCRGVFLHESKPEPTRASACALPAGGLDQAAGLSDPRYRRPEGAAGA